MSDTALSYHDLFITTAEIPRVSIMNLPFGVEVTCNRVGGWCVWSSIEGSPDRIIGGEFEGEANWLVLDVAGHVIVDSRRAVAT